ncbi:hypothetical protein MAFF212519_14630 [Clavibacter michiganensis]
MPRSARLIGAALALGLAGALVPTSAQATGPVDFGGATILDQVDAVTPAQEQQIQQAIDTLRTDTGITLHVAYVDTFTGEADQAAWGRATNSANGFGDSDALLAVAVDGRQVSFGAPAQLSESARDQLLQNGIRPELQDSDWSGPPSPPRRASSPRHAPARAPSREPGPPRRPGTPPASTSASSSSSCWVRSSWQPSRRRSSAGGRSGRRSPRSARPRSRR